MQYLILFLSTLLVKLPLFIVWLLALYLSLERWEKHPQVSKLTAIASIIFICLNIIQASLIFVQLNLSRMWTIEQISGLLSAFNFFLAIAEAIAWGLIIKAIFGWRRDIELF